MTLRTISNFTAARHAARASGSCTHCPTAAACLIGGGDTHLMQHWNSAAFAHIPLTVAGTALFETGDAADTIYIVRAGCIKTFTTDSEGNERVRGFHFPGSVIGLDALAADQWPASASAVMASQVCRIPKAQLHDLVAHSPNLMQQLLERTSASLAQALALSGDYTAEQRVAAFLLMMRDNAPAGQMSLRLPMTRRDIANYLRLATETVCRTLTRFEQKNWIALEPRHLQFLDAAALSKLAEPVGLCMRRPEVKLAA